MTAQALSRGGVLPAPVRIIHLGLGAFHRAHQAWYTAHAVDASEWGIAAFTGRSPSAADALGAQACLYTLIERGPRHDRVEVISSIVAAHDGRDLTALRAYAARPEVTVISLTVTEAGYRLSDEGDLDDADADLAADIAALAALGAAAEPTTAVGRLVTALAARRAGSGTPIAVVSCDNVPANGPWLGRGVVALAERADPTLVQWIRQNVSFVSTSVDRITPRPTAADIDAARSAGWIDAVPVVTEPFSDWTLAGAFPAGRPDWESAGAVFVDDIEPFEHRKLWLLNGAHSIMAAAGRERGLATVAVAAADTAVWALVESFWDEAARHLPRIANADAHRRSLKDRFANPRIEHHLAQIATDASTKLRVRVVPVARRELAEGRSASACAAAIGAWIRSAQLPGPTDANEAALLAAHSGSDPIRSLVGVLAPDLAVDGPFLDAVRVCATR